MVGKEAAPPTDVALVLNGGSSTVKFAVFPLEGPQKRLMSGKVDRLGQPAGRISVTRGSEKHTRELGQTNHASAASAVADALAVNDDGFRIAAIVHRLVHGGPRHFEPELLTAALIEELRTLRPFAPEHLPSELALIEACAGHFPSVPQIACFDTAFHRDLPTESRLLPLPRRLEAKGVRRYGFHGISYSYLLKRFGEIAGEDAACGRIIIAHLGSGASMVAIRNGKSIDTSMAFTPAAGFPMSTRSGDLDPGLFWYLGTEEKMSLREFHTLVNHESGLIGISETSADMRDLLSLAASDTRAAEAVEIFCYQARKWIGSFAAALGGLDALIFSGGIGENSPEVRARISRQLGFLGIRLDQAANEKNQLRISTAEGAVPVWVIPTDEEVSMLEAARSLVAKQA